MHRREKPAAPARLAAVGIVFAGEQHDEAGKVAVLATESVTEPRPQARSADDLVAGVHEDLRRRVVELRRPHRADDGDVVGDLGEIWEELRDLRPRLPVRFELERRREQLWLTLDEREALAPDELFRDVLAVVFVSAGFGSNRSICEGAPAMKRKMTRLARAGNRRATVLVPAPGCSWPIAPRSARTTSSSSDARARPPMPNDACSKKWRRVRPRSDDVARSFIAWLPSRRDSTARWRRSSTRRGLRRRQRPVRGHRRHEWPRPSAPGNGGVRRRARTAGARARPAWLRARAPA